MKILRPYREQRGIAYIDSSLEIRSVARNVGWTIDAEWVHWTSMAIVSPGADRYIKFLFLDGIVNQFPFGAILRARSLIDRPRTVLETGTWTIFVEKLGMAFSQYSEVLRL